MCCNTALALYGHGCSQCFILSYFRNPNKGFTNICYKDAETKTRSIRISWTIFVCVLSVSINPETALVSGECRAMLLWPAWDTTTRFSSLIKYIFISCHPIAAAEITNHSREAKHKPGGKLTPNTCSLLPLFRQFECCSHFLCTTALITYHYHALSSLTQS